MLHASKRGNVVVEGEASLGSKDLLERCVGHVNVLGLALQGALEQEGQEEIVNDVGTQLLGPLLWCDLDFRQLFVAAQKRGN